MLKNKHVNILSLFYKQTLFHVFNQKAMLTRTMEPEERKFYLISRFQDSFLQRWIMLLSFNVV